MAEFDVTDGDIQALAIKLDRMSDQFEAHERAALHAVWQMAATGIEAAASEVQGFGGQPPPVGAFTLRVSSPQGILIGLNQGSRGPVQVGVTFGKHGVAVPPPGFDGLEGG